MEEPRRVAYPGSMVFLCQGCHGELYSMRGSGRTGLPLWRCGSCDWLWEYTACGWRRVVEVN